MLPLCESFSNLIQKCTTVTSLRKARILHALILTSATTYHAQSPYLHNNLVSMYARCGSLADAQRVFDKMPRRNVVSYNALVAAFSKDPDCGKFSFRLLSLMGMEGLSPSGSTFTSLIQACCSMEERSMGSLLHAKVVKFGFWYDVCVQTSLLGMYSNCGDLESAEKAFGDVVEKDAVSWNSMVFGNLKNGRVKEGLDLFDKMVRSGCVVPTQFTYSMVFSACRRLGDYSCGQTVHARIIVSNVKADLPLQNALLDMYCNFGDIKSAFNVFGRIEDPDIVSWNTMISGYTGNGDGMEVIALFVCLLGRFLPRPDEYTFSTVIDATSAFVATHYGEPLHAQVVKVGLDSSVFVGTTLLSMYFENGDAESAQGVFDLIRKKDVVLWTEMIMGHSRLCDGERAVKLFCKMCQEGYMSDSFALSGALSACADLATMKQGEMIHNHAVKMGHDAEMFVCGSLIDMYAKNGDLQAAQFVFSQVSNPDLKCWNAMLGGYSHHGMVENAMMLFEEIIRCGLRPDQVTFLSLLSACSHSGLVEKGRFLWSYMKKNGIVPGTKHYSCMVSLLSRAGLLYEAKEVIAESSYSEQQLVLWRTLLSFSVNNRDLNIGVHAAEQILKLDPEDSASHILLSNLYASTGKWDFVAETRTKIRGMMVEKQAGLSWIESKSDIHVFSSSDQSNPIADEAQAEVDKLQKNMIKSVTDEYDATAYSM